jgi:hypothetical protein
MALTNIAAATLVNKAIADGSVLTVACPNGDVLTASLRKVIRWGHSRFALPNGREINVWNVGMSVVQQCGRGAAAIAARKSLGI